VGRSEFHLIPVMLSDMTKF